MASWKEGGRTGRDGLINGFTSRWSNLTFTMMWKQSMSMKGFRPHSLSDICTKYLLGIDCNQGVEKDEQNVIQIRKSLYQAGKIRFWVSIIQAGKWEVV